MDYLGDAFRPGLLRARYRSVACGELNPAYPYRVFYKILRFEIGIDSFNFS